MKEKKMTALFVITGGVVGLLAVALTVFGNPANMGVCVACFIRDTAGALGLHSAANVQYIRPEILGFIGGAFFLSLIRREFKPQGGSSPLLRFLISMFVIIGALVFLGCPLRMLLRLAGGDLNALVGLAGFIAGIALGSLMLKKGFSLGRTQEQPVVSGLVMPALAAALLAFLLLRPAFIRFSESGPGSLHAPVLIALAAGLIIGGFAQSSRMCMSGGFRDLILIKHSGLLVIYAVVFIAALAGNLATGKFHAGFANQPIAHSDFLWNFLGMALAGYGSVLLGGCPLRQTIMAGEGNADAAICVLGLVAGAALSHNFGLAASPQGVPLNGKIACVIGFGVITCIALFNSGKNGARA
ncbi:MAG: YedE-related selenium metabolism membrane protein [Spirochaetaceae bacterium]|jgi:YedE family putative selenium metabolism protein|nr:YedE-related selenium metabolism membrane protein [Spirochaetaceae bacterium]GMO23920.1 MAG: YedE family putative selenium transporter [Termitinemataceae bacterium]